MNSEIVINSHPFYENKKFASERELLMRLTELCKWDVSVGLIDYFPGPCVEIGILHEDQRSGEIPCFKEKLSLKFYFSSGEDIIQFHDLNFTGYLKVLQPILTHWVEVVEIVLSVYKKTEREKGMDFIHQLEGCLEYSKNISKNSHSVLV